MKRLQFLRHDEVFESRDDAFDYISDMLKTQALYAEPAIVKYGKAQNPNIIIAIGSVGTGSQKNGNRIFTIDTAKMEEDIKLIESEMNNNTELVEDVVSKIKIIINSCGLTPEGAYIKDIDDDLLKKANSLNEAIKILSVSLQELDKITTITTKDTNTVQLHVTQDSENGTVLYGDVKVSTYGDLDPDFNDNIIIPINDGLYAAADIDYDENNGILTFTASSKRTDGKVGARIIEKKFKVGLHTQLVSMDYDSDTETLVMTLTDGDGKTYTKKIPATGLIEEWEVANATNSAVVLTRERNKIGKDKLSADVTLSSGDFNILKKSPTTGGLFVKGTANNIQYINNLTVENALDNLALSDTTNLQIARDYTDAQVLTEANRAKAAEQAVQTNLNDEVIRAKSSEKVNADLITIINGDNDTIGSIKKSLKDSKIYTDSETVRATNAETTLQNEINSLNGNEAVSGSVKESIKISKTYTDAQVLAEKNRAVGVEKDINDNLFVINGNEAQVGSVKNAIDVSKKYTDVALSTHDDKALVKIEELKVDLDSEIKRATITSSETNTVKINVKQIDNVGTTISSDVKISNAKNNILISDNAGLFVTVSLGYSLAENALYFFNGVTDAPQKLQLSSGTLVHDAYYDASKKVIILEVIDANGGISKIEIPVGDLISGWNVGRKPESAVILTKEQINGTDYLYADVDVSTESDNLLSKRNGVLKVSNQATSIIYSGSLSVKSKIEDIETSLNSNKQIAKDYTDAQVLTEANRAKAAEQAERDRAMGVETGLQTSITNEIARAIKAEGDEAARAIAAEQTLDGKIGINTGSIGIINGNSTVNGSIAYMGKTVTDNMTHLIQDESDRAKEAEHVLDDKINSITGNGNGSITDTLDKAKKYTDDSIAPIAGQIDAAKNSAIATAATDASTKANQAQTNAIAAAAVDATTKADKALADAKIDSKEKADNAQANAITAAAVDATTKANQALADAKTYSNANQIFTTGATVSADNTKITVLFKDVAHNYEIDLTPIIKKAVDEAVAVAVAKAMEAIKYVGIQSDSCNVTVDNNVSPRTVKVDVYRIDNGMFS